MDRTEVTDAPERLDPDWVAFGMQLEHARRTAQLSTSALGGAISWSAKTIKRYEQGVRRPDRETVVRWERACGVPEGSLVDAYTKLTAPAQDVAAEPAEPRAPVAPEFSPAQRPTPPQASAAPARMLGRLVMGALGLAAVALSVVAGAVLGAGSGAPRGTVPELSQPAGTNGMTLRFPRDWHRSTGRFDALELGFTSEVQFARGEEAIAAGFTRARGPDLVLPSVLDRAGAGTSATVRFPHFDALRHTAAGLTLFAAPTEDAVLTVVCTSTVSRQLCEAVTASVSVGRPVFPVGPRRAYADVLDRVLTALNTDVARERAVLARSSTRAQQSRSATRASAEIRRARRWLAPVSLAVSARDAPAHRKLRVALERVEAALIGLANAARAGSRAAYSTAADRLRSADDRLDTAFANLGRLGYMIRSD